MILDKFNNTSKQGVFNLGTFFFLYIAQAIPMSFFSTVLQVIMREANYSYVAIALLQVIKLPWILKFLWAPMVDRYCTGIRRYKRTILTTELLYAVLILIVGHLSVDLHFYWVIALIFMSLVASGTQDIATDAMAVLAFKKKEKSMVNSMQSMGSFGGTLIGSGVLLFIFHQYGWSKVIPFLALFVMLAIIPLVMNKKLELAPKSDEVKARRIDFVWFFTQKGIWRQIGFLFLFYAPTIGLLSILRPYLVDLGYDMKEIGFLSGILGTASAFVSSFFGGVIVRRIGRFKARILFAAFAVATAAYFLAISFLPLEMWRISIGIMLVWMCYGVSTIVVYTTAMDCVRTGREGTDFTIQTVITHLSGMIIAVVSGSVVDNFGYTNLFIFELAIALASLTYILCVFRKPELVTQSVNEDDDEALETTK